MIRRFIFSANDKHIHGDVQATNVTEATTPLDDAACCASDFVLEIYERAKYQRKLAEESYSNTMKALQKIIDDCEKSLRDRQ
jgi:hypothetical protein